MVKITFEDQDVKYLHDESFVDSILDMYENNRRFLLLDNKIDRFTIIPVSSIRCIEIYDEDVESEV